MKLISAIVGVVIAIIAITTVMIPTLADNVPHDTTYSNISGDAPLYTYYEDSIPDLVIKWDGSKMTVNGSAAKWGNTTPAIATSALSIASQSGNSNPNITHIGIATDEGGQTTYGSQISGLTAIDLTVTGGKIAGTVKTSAHTYTIAETALDWAYVQAYGGQYTAIDTTAGHNWYTYGLDKITYQYRHTSSTTYTVHDGKVTKPNGDTVATLAASNFTAVDTIYDKDGVTVYKVAMPVKDYTAATTTWAIVNADVTVNDHKETTEETILNFVPLILIMGLLLGVVGLAIRRV